MLVLSTHHPMLHHNPHHTTHLSLQTPHQTHSGECRHTHIDTDHTSMQCVQMCVCHVLCVQHSDCAAHSTLLYSTVHSIAAATAQERSWSWLLFQVRLYLHPVALSSALHNSAPPAVSSTTTPHHAIHTQQDQLQLLKLEN